MSSRLPLRAPLAVALLLAGPLAPPAVQAQQIAAFQTQHRFALASQPLAQALEAFSRITGLSVIYTQALDAARQAPAVEGDLSAAAALQRLLAGSGYRYRLVNDHTLTLEPAADSGALDLGAVTIAGQADAPYSYRPTGEPGVLRTGTPTLETPQAVAVVPAQALRDQQPRNLDDALNNISGITQANTLGSTQDAVSKRGFGDNRDGSIMRDGLPSILGRNLGATADHVEVLKGPASLLYGIQDPGGVVNVVSKKPQLERYNAVTVRGSTFAHGKQGSGGTLDSTGAIGDSPLAYRLIVDHEDDEYWRNFGTYRQTLVAPSLVWYGEATTVTLSYEHREFKTPFDRGTVIDPNTHHPLDIPRSERLDEPFNITEGRSDLTRFAIDHHLDDDWTAHFAYGWTREAYDDNQARVTAVNPASHTLTRRIDGTHGAVSTDSFATASLDGHFTLGGLRNDATVGVDSEKRKIFRADLIRGSNSSFDYLDPHYGLLQPGSTADPASSDQTDLLRSDSLFLQDALHLDEHWILVAGGRYQVYDQYAGRGRPFQVNTDLNGQTWVPRAGVVYKLDDSKSLYLSYSESFRPNSTIAPLADGSVIDGSIAPEEGKSWEVGGKLDMPDRVTANVALFDIRKRNVMVSELVGTETVSRAAGEVHAYGLELDVTGQLSERWSLIGSYAWLHAEVTEDPEYQGKPLQNVAKTTASLAAVYDAGTLFGGDDLRLGAGARYVGDRAGDASNSFTLPAYTVADAFAHYDTRVGEHKVGLQLNVKNLFDRTYYPSAASTNYVSMGDPRQLLFSTTVEF